MRKRWPAIVVMSLLFTSYAADTAPSGSAQTLKEPAEPGRLPSKALILGVPFISWSEAARLDHRNKDILNPSFPASWGMILKYWEQDLTLLKQSVMAVPQGWVMERKNGKHLAELKPFIARGIPVFVEPALTPVAHTPSPVVAAMASVMPGAVTGEQADRLGKLMSEYGGSFSGVLGRMRSLDIFRQLEDLTNMSPWETLLESKRVVVGYDDDRKVVILHDPSFGPAWEVTYDDFEKMWAPHGRIYGVGYPPDYAEVLAKRSTAPPYPPRTSDQQAAVHFVFGYALSSVGRVVEAEEQIRKGLAIRGIGKGYQHLLLLELALHYGTRGNIEESNRTLQKAIELLPEHDRPWQFLAQNYRHEGWEQKAADAEGKAEVLCANRKAEKIVWKTLGRDFFIFGCEGLSARPN